MPGPASPQFPAESPVKSQLRALIEQGIANLRVQGTLPADLAAPDFVVERPKDRSHGDFASNVAMTLAKAARSNPRAVAQALIDALPANDDIAAVEIAGPGFLNFRLSPAAWQRQLRAVHSQGDAYGRNASGAGRMAGVEYVSANPTGPLHVGHGRAAAIGDCIARVLDANGWDVRREFYYNDAGVQIENLARSTQARAKGLTPADAGWPEDGYRGDYIADVAKAYLDGASVEVDGHLVTGARDAEDYDAIRRFAVAYLRREQNLDLATFGVSFDVYYLESSLYADGKVEETVRELIAHGHTYEDGGALWLRTTDYGDDKDRVMRKSDGGYTYFVPDVAYHVHKWQRGFDKVVNVQGSDHHGTIARVRAGLQAAGVGIPAGWPDYVLHKMVTVMKGGEEVKISKRAGSYVTLRDLIEWTSRDAVRFFLISRKADTEFVFDVDLALKANDENPVFYVQYAHARICSVLEKWKAEHGGDPATLATADLSGLTAPSEYALMNKLAEYPAMLARAAEGLAPHDVAFYLRDVAAAYHSYYAAVRFLDGEAAAMAARMALLQATAQVLRNALAVLGVSAPSRM